MTNARKLLLQGSLVAALGGVSLALPERVSAATGEGCDAVCVSSCEAVPSQMCAICEGTYVTCNPASQGSGGLDPAGQWVDCSGSTGYVAFCAWAC